MKTSNVKDLSVSKIDLNVLITETYLGSIVFVGNTPTKTELLEGIKSKNYYACGLTVNDFKYLEGTYPQKKWAIIVGTGQCQGEILINNNDLRDIDLVQYLHHIGYIEQNPQILFGTFLENISYSKQNVNLEEIKIAAEKANLHHRTYSVIKFN